ncbi:uncharacterized protein LOC114580499 [Dendrobium catenatum]|uniref:uncharacterized protein LOC114580499 n=1 Tax=Dendrobium catenatum TaxID=906689 RepID=UPI0010A06C62|nr:uncharacterized protein LOC114580499 [Dendrobium catenatum]
MQCPSDRKVHLAVFLLDGEAEYWWVGQQEAKFQGRLNSLITWEEFTEAFRDWFVPPSTVQQMQESFLRLVQGSKTVMQYVAEFTALARYTPQLVSTSAAKCYHFLRGLRDSLRQPLVPFHISDFSELVERAHLIENDLIATQQRWTASRKRFGGDASGSSSSGKRRFVSGSGDSRKSGQSEFSGTATPSTTSSGSAGFDRRSNFRSEGFVRPAGLVGRSRTVPPRPVSKGFSVPAPVQSRVYSLSQQKARDSLDVVTASHSFLSERCFDALHLPSILLPVSLSVILPAGSNLIARKFCFCVVEIAGKKWKSSLIFLPISLYDVILGMD